MVALVGPFELLRANLTFAPEDAVPETGLHRCWTPASRRNWCSCGVSGLVHLAALGIAGLIGLSLPAEPDLPALDSVWSEPEHPADLPPEIIPASDLTSPDPGGRTAEGIAAWQEVQPLARSM